MAPSFDSKVKLLEEIDAYARAKDPRVRQVSVSFGATWQIVYTVSVYNGPRRESNFGFNLRIRSIGF